MTTVQERHFAVGFDPDFVAGVLGKDREGSDMEAEFASLGELAYVAVRI
jgi:hypothetical protein